MSAALGRRFVADLESVRQPVENASRRQPFAAELGRCARCHRRRTDRRDDHVSSVEFSFPAAGLDSNSFGSYVVSNIGTVGLDTGFGSLLPSSNVSLVFILGTVQNKPAIVNGEIVPRRIMLLSATLDHRVVDGSHGGLLFRAIKHMAKNPEILETKPDPSKAKF